MPNQRLRTASAAGLGAVFLAAIAFESFAIAQTWGLEYTPFKSAAAAVVCGLALLRHRDATVAAFAGLAVAALTIPVPGLVELPAEPGPALALGLSVLTGHAVRILPVPRAAAVAATGLFLVAGCQLVAWHFLQTNTTVAVVNAIAWLGAVAVGLYLRMLDARTRATAEKVRRDERLELARELHDAVAHHITGMLVQAQAAQIVARRTPEKVPESLAGIEAAGAEALAAMRRAVGLLRDTADAAPSSPGPERLGELVERFHRQGPPVKLTLPDDTAWPPEVKTTLYRIVQESLTNIARHAPQARSVTVTVDRDDRSVTVEVVDDAPTVPPRPHHRPGYGLIGMRERVEMLGGTLVAGPSPGGGWSVAATLPTAPKGPR
ncbi:sensor histidine kinase [Actinocorallia sp. B10E7]|uniref:sensor histidine kinase n=1 Tax=Actinocorallia sp. B10E7 TaxID=3153558 RepID=UPI00325C60AC